MTPLIIFLLFCLSISFIVYFSHKEECSIRSSLKNALGKEMNIYFEKQQNHFSGLDYHFKYCWDRGGCHLYFYINFENRNKCKISFSEREIFAMFLEKSGLSKRVRTGDVGFDQDVFVDTNSSELAQHFLIDAEMRYAVKDILKRGFREINFESSRIYIASKDLRKVKKHLSKESIECVLTHIIRLKNRRSQILGMA